MTEDRAYEFEPSAQERPKVPEAATRERKGPKKTCRRCGTHHWQQGDYCRQCQTSLDKGEWAEVLSETEAMDREMQRILDAAPKQPRDVYKLITYPFPMSDGTMAYLNLPEVISRKDVERMCEMLRTLPYSEGV